MKIRELIVLLQGLPDKEREVFITNQSNDFTSSIGYSVDDNNDVQLYEISDDETFIKGNEFEMTKIVFQ